jgi:predicted nucleic acid-binding protein
LNAGARPIGQIGSDRGMFVVDTSAIIGATERVRQTPSLIEMIVDAVTDTEIAVTEITLGELRHSVAAARDTVAAAQRRRTLNAFSEMLTLSIHNDRDVLDQYAVVRTRQPRCGQNDTWIIAICAALGATLVTEDDDMRKLADANKTEVLFLRSEPG